MQEVFSKIIEKLEELKKAEIERDDFCDEEGYGDGEEIYEDGKSQGRFEQAVRIIKIVKQEAEKFGTDTNVGSNGWIPCSERLPKYGEVVMCSCTNNGITISCITHKGVKPSKSVRFGQHSVIAWQPLPQTYTNGE